jgi:hypothetical protein
MLKNDERFATLVLAIKDLANKAANTALDAAPDQVLQKAGYARALRDIFIALEAERTGVIQQKIKAPGVKE